MQAAQAEPLKPGRLNRTQRRSKATRKKILKSAREVFAHRGIDLSTIDEITQHADIGKGTFYYHFHDKNDVVVEILEEILDQLMKAMEKKCVGAQGLNDLLDRIIGAHIEFFSARWVDFVLYFQGRADLKLEICYEGIESPFIRYIESMEDLLDSVIRTRVSRPTLRRIGCAIAGFLSGYYSFAAVSSEDDDIDQTFMSLRGALVASLVRFVNEAIKTKDDFQ